MIPAFLVFNLCLWESNMRRLLAVMVGAVLTASCSDSVTSPAPMAGAPVLDASPEGCVTEGTCPLDPIIVIGDPGGGGSGGGGSSGGGGHDPGDDGPGCELMEGGEPTLQGCPGGSGGQPYTPPPDGNGLTPSPSDDLIAQDSLPDCSNSATWTQVWHAPYCNGYAPTGSLLTAFNAELATMEAKGGFCAELAQHGRTLLSQGRVRYYAGSGTTLRSWGGPSVGIIMDNGFVSNPAPYDHGFALAHELEHAYSGYQHTAGDVDANGVHRTPHDGLCG